MVDDLTTSATDALERGDIAEAERLARRAVRAAGALPDTARRQAAMAGALRALGSVHRARGRYRAALVAFRRSMACARLAFGDDSVRVAELHNDLGMTFKYLGRFTDADAEYARARTILEALPDPDPEDVAALYHNLGGLAHARGDYAAAEPLARRSVEIRAAALGPRATATLLDRSAHAAILSGLGRRAEAEAEIRDVLPGLELDLGPDHPEVAVALNNLAAIVQTKGDLTGAETMYRRVIEIRAARFGPGSPVLASSLSNLGTVLRAQGRNAEAAESYERALDLLEGVVDDTHPTVRTIRRNRARLASGVGERSSIGNERSHDGSTAR